MAVKKSTTQKTIKSLNALYGELDLLFDELEPIKARIQLIEKLIGITRTAIQKVIKQLKDGG